MMWNLLISGLLVGSTIVLYDGSPGHPDQHVVAARGEASRHLLRCLGAIHPRVPEGGVAPGRRVRHVRHSGAGLHRSAAIGRRLPWVADAVGKHVQICSMSGGTDLCTAFLESVPTVPVWLGELSCAALGAAVAAYDERGAEWSMRWASWS